MIRREIGRPVIITQRLIHGIRNSLCLQLGDKQFALREGRDPIILAMQIVTGAVMARLVSCH